jgi:toxin ParE1/3/4
LEQGEGADQENALSYGLIIRSSAQRDIADLALRYNRKEFGLGEWFLICLDAALQGVARNAEIYRVVRHEYRKVLVKRFPVGVFFVLRGNAVYVDAVIDLRSDPKQIEKRLRTRSGNLGES